MDRNLPRCRQAHLCSLAVACLKVVGGAAFTWTTGAISQDAKCGRRLGAQFSHQPGSPAVRLLVLGRESTKHYRMFPMWRLKQNNHPDRRGPQSPRGAAVHLRVPLVLLALLLGTWVWLAIEAELARSEAARVVLGPVFNLELGVSGAWEPNLKDWPDSKGTPTIWVQGLSAPAPGTIPKFEVELRVEPQSSLLTLSEVKRASDGWISANELTDGASVARIDKNGVQRIEYRVVNASDGGSRRAQLMISGEDDSDRVEMLLIRKIMINLVCGGPAALLCSWIAVRWYMWRRSRCADDHKVSSWSSHD